MVRPSGAVVTSLPTDQEDLGWISGPAVGFFSNGGLFYGIWTEHLCAFKFSLKEAGILLIIGQKRP